MRQKAIVDSIKAAANLSRVSRLISNYPGTKVESIHASDSDEYVTVVVRVHIGGSAIPILSPAPIIKIKTGDIVAHELGTVTVPPFRIVETDTIFALPAVAAAKLNTGAIALIKLPAVIVPPFPFIMEDIEALPAMAAFRLNTEAIVFIKMPTATVPPFPFIMEDIETLPLMAASKLHTGEASFNKMLTVIAPPLPNLRTQIDALPLAAAIQHRTEQPAAGKLATATVPAFPEIEAGALTLSAAVKLPTEATTAGKMHTVAVPVFEEMRMSVGDMHLSPEGYSLLEKLEGFSPELYGLGDGGFTIGFGFFIPFNDVSKWRKGVTWEDAERMIRQKVPAYEDQVKQYINVPLTQEEFDALTMLAYNLGSFSRATSIVNDINTNADFEKLQHDWMRFVHSKAPRVMKGLMNRRKDELLVRSESNYQPERKIQVLKNRK